MPSFGSRCESQLQRKVADGPHLNLEGEVLVRFGAVTGDAGPGLEMTLVFGHLRQLGGVFVLVEIVGQIGVEALVGVDFHVPVCFLGALHNAVGEGLQTLQTRENSLSVERLDLVHGLASRVGHVFDVLHDQVDFRVATEIEAFPVLGAQVVDRLSLGFQSKDLRTEDALADELKVDFVGDHDLNPFTVYGLRFQVRGLGTEGLVTAWAEFGNAALATERPLDSQTTFDMGTGLRCAEHAHFLKHTQSALLLSLIQNAAQDCAGGSEIESRAGTAVGKDREDHALSLNFRTLSKVERKIEEGTDAPLRDVFRLAEPDDGYKGGAFLLCFELQNEVFAGFSVKVVCGDAGPYRPVVMRVEGKRSAPEILSVELGQDKQVGMVVFHAVFMFGADAADDSYPGLHGGLLSLDGVPDERV